MPVRRRVILIERSNFHVASMDSLNAGRHRSLRPRVEGFDLCIGGAALGFMASLGYV
jgi:hypothetical protein